MRVRPAPRKNQERIAWGITLVLISVCGFFLCLEEGRRVSAQARQVPNRRGATYRDFQHDVQAHRQECSTCHKFPSPNWNKVRSEAEAFPDITEYPQHQSCLGCHRQQFFRGARPAICSVCHVNPSPRDSRRHPFPNPPEIFDQSAKGKEAESDFQIAFPHAVHIEIVSRTSGPRSIFRNASFTPGRTSEESCAVCHKTLHPQGDGSDEFFTKPPADLGDGFWLKKGTFKSVPRGHTACFTCHSADSGLKPSPDSCSTCHALKPASVAADFDPKLAGKMGVTDRVVLNAWKLRDSTGKFRHEWFSHNELSCSTCHNAESMNTLSAASKRVGMSSCSTCHATATTDDGGALNFEWDARKADPKFECTKCHVVFGRQPVPESHRSALVEAGAKP